MHDACPLQLAHIVVEILTHASDLPVQPLHQRDAKNMRRYHLYLALLGARAHDGNAIAHALQKSGSNGLHYCYFVFLLMVISGTEYFVDDIAVAGKQDQPFALFIQSANGEYAAGIMNERYNIIALGGVGGANNAGWFVQCEIYVLLYFEINDAAIYPQLVFSC